MQVAVMFIFLAVWLLVFWIGSIALEKTGMDRGKARFQALSALTGTGFTTREAESIVNHPRRRQIATWLIFIGNAGIIAFIILMIFYLRSGLAAPSLLHIGILVGTIVLFVLVVRLRLIDKLTNGILKLVRKGRVESYIQTEEILYQTGNYGIAHIIVKEKDIVRGFTLEDMGFENLDITVLAIERGDEVFSFTKAEDALLAGDYILCYGNVKTIICTKK